MRVVLAYCDKDKHIAIRLAEWIRDLGGVKNHDCLLTVARSTTSQGVIEILREAFNSVTEFTPYDDSTAYPDGASLLWKRTAEMIAEEKSPQPWFWIEPDAVPLRSTWVDEIEAEYLAAKKPFLADLVVTPTSTHNSGLGVYPGRVVEFTGRHSGRLLFMLENHSWDVYFSPDFLPYTHHTDLIQDVFWQHYKPDIAPEFPDQASLSYLDPKACIFHRQKSGSLLARLREMKVGLTSMALTESVNLLTYPRFFTAENVEGGTFPRNAGVSEKTRKTIHTYYAPVDAISRFDSERMIEIWKAEWEFAGWNPVVIGEKEARLHPRFEEFYATFKKFPSSNPDGYDLACFLRWVAMAAIGGGWMCDFDVLPNSGDFKTRGDISFFSGNERDPLIPCLVHGTKEGFEAVLMHFLSHEPTGNHTSDMVALRDYSSKSIGGVLEYGEPGWHSAKAVHFSNHSMGDKQPKHDYVIRLHMEGRKREYEANQPEPKSLTEQMRDHCNALSVLVDGQPGRRNMLHTELRKAKLMAQPNKRS